MNTAPPRHALDMLCFYPRATSIHPGSSTGNWASNGYGQTLRQPAGSPAARPWAMRDCTLTDPSGVLWHVAENTAAPV